MYIIIHIYIYIYPYYTGHYVGIEGKMGTMMAFMRKCFYCRVVSKVSSYRVVWSVWGNVVHRDSRVGGLMGREKSAER